jgi:hypothetical protein
VGEISRTGLRPFPDGLLTASIGNSRTMRPARGTAVAIDIQLIVNGVALPPQPLTPGTPVRVGVADPAGFTEVAIVALGGYTQAFIASEFAFVPMP